MSHLSVTSEGPSTAPPARKGDEVKINRESEFIWVQKNRVAKVFVETLEHLRHCCLRLHLAQKCDERMNIPSIHPSTEKYNLNAKQGGDNLKATVTLLDDNVIQAEVTIKYAKAAGGFYRAVARPDVQWKLQQLQDLGNHVARATVVLCDIQYQIKMIASGSGFTKETGYKIIEEAKAIKNEIYLARSSILLPRKRSLLELCYFPPTRKFVPPLPQDQLLSFYISSCRLVCASYQMVPKTVHPQGLSVFMAECQLPNLDEVLRRLNNAMNCLQHLISYVEMCE